MTTSRVNILLVEDDAVDVMNVRRAFLKNGIHHPVFLAGNGVEALDMLRSGRLPPQRRLVLLDLNMPRMNGLEFLREVRADPALARTAVVVLTTSHAEQDVAEAHRLNVAGYFLKPVELAEFVRVIATLDDYWMLVEMT